MSVSRGPDGRPIAFHDLPADHFPVQVTCLAPDDSVVWERTIEPYVATEVPELPDALKGKCRVRFRFATGEVLWQAPMSVEESRAYIERRIEESQDAE